LPRAFRLDLPDSALSVLLNHGLWRDALNILVLESELQVAWIENHAQSVILCDPGELPDATVVLHSLAEPSNTNPLTNFDPLARISTTNVAAPYRMLCKGVRDVMRGCACRVQIGITGRTDVKVRARIAMPPRAANGLDATPIAVVIIVFVDLVKLLFALHVRTQLSPQLDRPPQVPLEGQFDKVATHGSRQKRKTDSSVTDDRPVQRRTSSGNL